MVKRLLEDAILDSPMMLLRNHMPDAVFDRNDPVTTVRVIVAKLTGIFDTVRVFM